MPLAFVASAGPDAAKGQELTAIPTTIEAGLLRSAASHGLRDRRLRQWYEADQIEWAVAAGLIEPDPCPDDGRHKSYPDANGVDLFLPFRITGRGAALLATMPRGERERPG